MTVVIVVPEAFSNFAKNENCLPYSELVACLRQDNLDIGAMKGSKFIAGQGLDELQLDHVECLSARRGLREAFLHWRVWHVANLADRALCHKHLPENILISKPVQSSDNVFTSDLFLHSRNELMLDHLTGQHIQGMVLTEACRQMFLAVTEKYFLQDYHAKKRYFVIDTMTMRYNAFAFPLPAQITYKVLSKNVQKSHKRSFHVDMEVMQCSKPVCGMEAKFSVFDDEYIAAKEQTLASETLAYYVNDLRSKTLPVKSIPEIEAALQEG